LSDKAIRKPDTIRPAVNGLGLVLLSAAVSWQAVQQLIHPQLVVGWLPIAVGVFGVVGNWVLRGCSSHGHSIARQINDVSARGFHSPVSLHGLEAGDTSRPEQALAELSALCAHRGAPGALDLAVVQYEPRLVPESRNSQHVMQRGVKCALFLDQLLAERDCASLHFLEQNFGLGFLIRCQIKLCG
jgi:Co/Zn/Cd efflux system component